MIKSKGFTLVELLIVIIVIGILSTMMMLSSTEAVNFAQATKIISDFTQLKKAVTAWYLENDSRTGTGAGGVKDEKGIYYNGKVMRFSDFINAGGGSEFLKYISGGNSITIGSKTKNKTGDYYIIRSVDKSRVWYVSYYIKNKPHLQAKFASRAGSLGLVGCADLEADSVIKTAYTNQNYVNLVLLDLN